MNKMAEQILRRVAKPHPMKGLVKKPLPKVAKVKPPVMPKIEELGKECPDAEKTLDEKGNKMAVQGGHIGEGDSLPGSPHGNSPHGDHHGDGQGDMVPAKVEDDYGRQMMRGAADEMREDENSDSGIEQEELDTELIIRDWSRKSIVLPLNF